MADKKILEVRKTIKARKPKFLQQDYHKKRRLSAKWKRPTGLQSKMRHQFKGYARRVKQGWRSPVEIRGFDKSGMESVMVHTLNDLSKIKSGQGIIIASNVGAKKKIMILDKAAEMNIKILNIKPEVFKARIAETKRLESEDKKAKAEKKKKTLEDSIKKSEKKEQEKKEKDKKAEEPASEEEKKEQEKKEKDEVLIHKA